MAPPTPTRTIDGGNYTSRLPSRAPKTRRTKTNTLVLPNFQPAEQKDNGLSLNPNSNFAHADAMRAILVYLLAESFDLNPEEAAWVGHNLDGISGILMNYAPETVPLSVRQEMINGTYTQLLEVRENTRKARGSAVYDTRVVSATIEEWVDLLMLSIGNSYTLPLSTETKIRLLFADVLRNLGVEHPTNPRSSVYLPTEMRQRILNKRRSARR